MSTLQRLCVYCGANPGEGGSYQASAERLAQELAQRHIGLVYGGGNVGMMGTLADAMLASGGEAIGVIPTFLVEREQAHHGLTRLDVVTSMHERKARMAELADGFIALPGGFGTLEELFEALTWGQLGLHAKPCALLNVDGYFDALVAFLDQAVEAGFLKADNRRMLVTGTDPGELLDALVAYRPPQVERWLPPDGT